MFAFSLSTAVSAQEEWITPSEEDAILAAQARIGGDVSVGIELVDEPTAVVFQKALKGGADKGSANAQAKKRLGKIKAEQARLRNELRRVNAEIFFETQRTFNGFGAHVSAAAVDELRNLAGVKSVHLLAPHTPTNAGSVPFIGAPAAWVAGSGANSGTGIRIGIIDSGIDYIHTNMGGPGAGYAANNTKIVGDTPGIFPGAKVAGGWDFAGDTYDAGGATAAIRTPVPDPDPMDCGGHGSHVAGSAAGYGVRPDGSTYPGPYDGTTPFGSLKIGPGVAPGAQLYALRVFGCSGSTLLTVAAIEWATDPNGDGDFSDRLDVVNMSLGAAFGSSFDASTVATQNASLAGVIMVVAAGNNGDTHYTVGSPGTAARAVTVAASQDDGMPGLRVNGPAAIAGLKPMGKSSGWGGALTDPGVTADVVATVPADACNTVTNLAAVAGKIAFIDRGGTAPGGAACGFELKAKNAQNAGAVGVIIGNVPTSANPLVPITMGASAIGGVTIPAAQLGLGAANEIRAQLASGLVNATLLRSATASLPAIGDLAASFSSRGIRRGDNVLKPDISAPGVAIESTLVGSGTNAFDNNGTSMATPHVAGMMALLRQLHPDWSVEELKALAMNTAAHDLFLGINQAPPRYGVARAGAGRANLGSASSASVVAMNTQGDGSVSVSFGAVEVVGTYSATKTIQVVNKGAVDETYNVSLFTTTDVPGVSYSLPGGGSITVGAGETVTLPVQLSATASAMTHALDPTMSATQTNTGGTVLNRTYLSEESAYVVLTPSAGPTLRVPVHAVVRPASAMATTQTAFALAGASGTTPLNLAGSHVNMGTTLPVQQRSLVSAFELAGTSPNITAASSAARRAADIKAVGVSSDAKQRGTTTGAVIYFGISTHGKWSTLFDVEFDIFIDRNRDGVEDVVFFNTTQSNGQNRLDVHGTSVLTLPAQTTVPGSVFSFVGGVNPSLDTVPYNSNVIVLAVRAQDLGVTAATGRFNYRITTFARGLSGSVDTFRGSYDPLRPGLNFNVGFTGAPLFLDLNGGAFNVAYNTADHAANASQGILLLHHYNADGARDQILPATQPTATTTAVAAAAGQYSDVVTLSASVSPSSFFDQPISGTVAFSVDGTPVGSAAVDASGNASLAYTISGGAGGHTISATFTSSSAFYLGSSGSGSLSVSHENADVAPSAGNPGSVQVTAPGGNANFSLSADITEVADGSLGNIGLASPVTVTLTPIGPGSAITQTASLGVNGTTLTASAAFANVPVNVYDVTFSIGGSFYTGGASSVVAVFDPSLGNVTGGGTLFVNGVRASFGLNVKYQKNGNAQGQILYVEHRPTGVVKVKSNAVGTLSIAGNTAIVLGKATVSTGSGNHDFRLIVVDNGEPGSSDQLGLTITGMPDLTFDPITLSGGNVQVPK
ncbi:MAG TPA: S8 family serine peptidase [Thermoanaerobaculia bacterium]|nr:S8 family serine peptidase [Thermoanaerobaculia bacterium]